MAGAPATCIAFSDKRESTRKVSRFGKSPFLARNRTSSLAALGLTDNRIASSITNGASL